MGEQRADIGKEIIRGLIDMIILHLLDEQDRYGYELYKQVLARSSGQYELKEPSLYSAFRRLEAEGAIRSYWGGETQGGRRKYYAITETGKSRLDSLKAEWRMVKSLMRNLTGE